MVIVGLHKLRKRTSISAAETPAELNSDESIFACTDLCFAYII